MSDEHEFEPVRGLPEQLPAGERLLWQGEPSAAGFARSAFGIRALAVYFALLIVAQGLFTAVEQGSLAAVTTAALGKLPLAGGALALLALFGWCYARTTVYTVTNARVVIRFGIAVPLTVNIPFTSIAGAGLHLNADGSGDLELTLAPDHRVGYVAMWPCVKAWRFSSPRPVLRGLPHAAQAARMLADALQASSGVPATSRIEVPRRPVLVRTSGAAA